MERDVILRDGRMLRIRRPRGEDAARLLDYLKIIGGETDFLLFDGAGLPYTIEQEAAVLERFFAEPRGGMFVGEIDGEIACTFNLSCNGRPRVAHVAEIAVAVQKKFWGIGVGSAVMETLISLAREQGVKTIELGVYAGNLRAQALYRRYGFEECGRHEGRFFVKGTYHDEILMDLHL
ncbi:MAG: putative acetyltransferase YhhY [Firmicutes bacterium ADurb.Bin248]|nr:MAG: putative acetyltransferase YhhY [Firmicutes bacterium ADurb.Bin248]